MNFIKIMLDKGIQGRIMFIRTSHLAPRTSHLARKPLKNFSLLILFYVVFSSFVPLKAVFAPKKYSIRNIGPAETYIQNTSAWPRTYFGSAMFWWDWNRSVSRYESLETNWRFGIQNLKESCMVDEDGVLYWLGQAGGSNLLTYGRMICVLKYTASSSGIVRSARNFIYDEPLTNYLEQKYNGKKYDTNYKNCDPKVVSFPYKTDKQYWGTRLHLSAQPIFASESAESDKLYINWVLPPERIRNGSYGREALCRVILKKSDLSVVDANNYALHRAGNTGQDNLWYQTYREWHPHDFNLTAYTAFYDVSYRKYHYAFIQKVHATNEAQNSSNGGVRFFTIDVDDDNSTMPIHVLQSFNHTNISPTRCIACGSLCPRMYSDKGYGYIWLGMSVGYTPIFYVFDPAGNPRGIYAHHHLENANGVPIEKCRISYPNEFYSTSFNRNHVDYAYLVQFVLGTSSRNALWDKNHLDPNTYTAKTRACGLLALRVFKILSGGIKTQTVADSIEKDPQIAPDAVLYKTSIGETSAEPKSEPDADATSALKSTKATLYRNTHVLCFYKDYIIYAYCYPGKTKQLILGYAPYWIDDKDQIHVGTKVEFVDKKGNSFSHLTDCERVFFMDCRNGHVWLVWMGETKKSGSEYTAKRYIFHAFAEDIINS